MGILKTTSEIPPSVPLHVLILEDKPADAELVLDELRQAGFAPESQRVETEADYIAHLNPALDVILADYTMPQFDALRALQLLQEQALDIPFIVVSGTIGEDLAVKALKEGATDYLLKDRLARLGEAVNQAVREKKLRDEKRQAEVTLRALFDNLDAVFFSIDMVTFKMLQVSPACEKVYGVSQQAFLADPSLWRAVIHPDDRPGLEANQSARFHAGQPVYSEYRIVRPDGDIRWVEARITPSLNETGQVIRLDGFVTDVTQRKHTEEALRASETTEREQRILAESLRDVASALTSTVDSAAVMRRILENVGRVVPHDRADISLIEGSGTNIAYCRGWSPEEENRLKAARFPLDTPNIRQMLTDNVPLLIPDTESYPGWRKISSQTRSFLGTPIRIHNIVVGFLELSSAEPGFFIAQDAEHLRVFADQAAIAIESAQLYETLRQYTAELEQRVEQRTAELHRTKEHTEAILKYNSDAILVVRSDGTISQVNPAFSLLFSYRPDEIVGQSLKVLVKPDLVTGLESAFNSVLRGNQAIRIEVEARRKDDTRFSADMALSAISRQPNEAFPSPPAEVVCSIRDISAYKRAEEELRQAIEKEKELSELKDRFTSMVSHEFRAPLTVIRMSGELMVNFPERFGEERKLKFLQDILAQVQYMVQLIDDILIIGKAQAHKIQFNPQPMDAHSFSETVVERIQLTDAGKHRFSCVANGDLANVQLDEALLGHILVNLLSNAIKYSPPGSEIRFEVNREGNTVVFRVGDEGIGIPKADQAHLFEAFHRAANASHLQGTGLGLSIVAANVALHGGMITFNSEENVGTTFTVRLPATAQHTASDKG